MRKRKNHKEGIEYENQNEKGVRVFIGGRHVNVNSGFHRHSAADRANGTYGVRE